MDWLLDKICDGADWLMDHWWQSGIVLVLAIVLFVQMGGCGRQHFERAKVINTTFVPQSVSYATNGKGGLVVAPERWVIAVARDNGQISTVEIDSQMWAKLHLNSEVEVDVRWWGIADVRILE